VTVKTESATSSVLLADRFEEARPPGAVIGKTRAGGLTRKGSDREGVIGIDNGALRLGFFKRPGWGREGLAYGPFERREGLTFLAFLLNGHNGSQTYPIEGLSHFLRSLARKAFCVLPEYLLPRFAHRKLYPSVPHYASWPPLIENLAVGFFPIPSPRNPGRGSNTFLVRSAGIENADITLTAEGKKPPVIQGVGNLPLCYAVSLRKRGAVYYLGSSPGTTRLPQLPILRPVGIDTRTGSRTVYAGVQQSVLGEIGFSCDTRIYGTYVIEKSSGGPQGTACAADSFRHQGPLDGREAECGGPWQVLEGGFLCEGEGASPLKPRNLAVVSGSGPTGLLHFAVMFKERSSSAGLVFRFVDSLNYLLLRVSPERADLLLCEDGRFAALASRAVRLRCGRSVSVFVLDDSVCVQAFVKGEALFEKPVEASSLPEGNGAGFSATGPCRSVRIASFEAHPREVALESFAPVPDLIEKAIVWQKKEGPPVLREEFGGQPCDLRGKRPEVGCGLWERTEGSGTIRLTGTGRARVLASRAKPNPGRTLYTLPWSGGNELQIKLHMIPPGTGPGCGEKGRGGVVFWQDTENYLIVSLYLDDWHTGKSLSSFYRFGGKEDLYRAVWTNVGDRIHWGRPVTLSVAFDGARFVASLNGEPVLARAISDVVPAVRRLQVNRVGIAVNREFGDDTGSVFLAFEGRSAAS